MKNLNISKEDYNSIPVKYCKHCLSLRIMGLYYGTDYCDNCGLSDVGETSIEEWERLYKEKYKREYINTTEESLYNRLKFY